MDNGDVGEVGKNAGGDKYVGIIVAVVIILVIIGIIIGIIFALRGGGKKVGQPCNNGTECDDNLVCQNRTNPALPTNKVCLAQSGGKCTSSSGCVAGSNCVSGTCS
uniref:Transmembrane protein n=1 Tax=Pithovirus LCPAC401 TaxID=2506595 RepID=A0A481ZCI8_9VIRU|nr:MAG: transmembrane protein [Pithovirus LCPAC401]